MKLRVTNTLLKTIQKNKTFVTPKFYSTEHKKDGHNEHHEEHEHGHHNEPWFLAKGKPSKAQVWRWVAFSVGGPILCAIWTEWNVINSWFK